MAFVHLHNYSEYSIGESVINIEAMVRRAASLGMPAVAVTDKNSMAGLPDLQRACDKVSRETGAAIRPLFGCELTVLDDTNAAAINGYRRHSLVLLAKNAAGYANLCYLCSVANDAVPNVRLTETVLRGHAAGLAAIASSDGSSTINLTTSQRLSEFTAWARRMMEAFDAGSFYLELQDQTDGLYEDERKSRQNPHLVEAARKLGVGIVAGNGCRMLDQHDATALAALYCHHANITANDIAVIAKKLTCNRHFRTEQEMRKTFSHFPEACDTTVEIADACAFRLPAESPASPRPCPPLPKGRTAFEVLYGECERGLKRRYGEPLPAEAAKRLGHELEIIGRNGFAADFLVAKEAVGWCRENAIMVGPGRGAAPGSIACYALGITDVDSIANSLLSERFIDPESRTHPTIDLDVEVGALPAIFDHLREVYGSASVARTSEYATFDVPQALRVASDYLECSAETYETVLKTYRENRWHGPDALSEIPEIAELCHKDRGADILVSLAQIITGRISRQSTHSCAVILSRNPLASEVPLRRDAESDQAATQLRGRDCKSQGYMLIGFPELSALSVMRKTLDGIALRAGERIDPESIDLTDTRTLELLSSGESMVPLNCGPKDVNEIYLSKLPRVEASDVTAMFALCRPGPEDNGILENYLDIIGGTHKEAVYLEPVQSILAPTHGIIAFQEQVMQLAEEMCGFSEHQANALHRAIATRNREKTSQLEQDWLAGALANGIDERTAKKLWSDADHLGPYCFCRAHAAAYATIYIRLAWLQAHHQNDFLATMLAHTASERPRAGSKPFLATVAACRRHRIGVLPPDINESQRDFALAEDGTGIRYGLAHITRPDAAYGQTPYLGAACADTIVSERVARGPFASPQDYLDRMQGDAASDGAIRALVEAGAFDRFGKPRRALLNQMLSKSGSADTAEWSLRTELHLERAALGFYASDNPLNHCQIEGGRPPLIDGHLLTRLERGTHLNIIGTVIGDPGSVMDREGRPIVELAGSISFAFVHIQQNLFASHKDDLVDEAVVQIGGSMLEAKLGQTHIAAYAIKRLDDCARGVTVDKMDVYRAFLGDEASQAAVAQYWLDGREAQLRSFVRLLRKRPLSQLPYKAKDLAIYRENMGRETHQSINQIKIWAERAKAGRILHLHAKEQTWD